METFRREYPAGAPVSGRSHVGVVGSGDLEVLLEPADDQRVQVTVQTSVDGFEAVWGRVLDRFFANFAGAARIEIRDCGATPGTVRLRLEQAVAELRSAAR
jgi:malonate decarboxylase delta subunit